jgi:hypothetical protein
LFKAARPITVNNSEVIFYEVTMAKNSYLEDLPKQLGSYILTDAKSKIHDFVFLFLHRYFGECTHMDTHVCTTYIMILFASDRKYWSLCSMDTDSCYIKQSVPNLDDVVYPELVDEYRLMKPKYIATTKYDQRTPGCFKEECK